MTQVAEAIARYHKLIESEPYIDLAWAGALEERLTKSLGTKVRLRGSGSRGRIEIEFYSGDELARLLERLET